MVNVVRWEGGSKGLGGRREGPGARSGGRALGEMKGWDRGDAGSREEGERQRAQEQSEGGEDGRKRALMRNQNSSSAKADGRGREGKA